MTEQPSGSPPAALPTATGSRRADIALFLALAALILGTAPRLRVYYEVTAVQVEVELVLPDGERRELPTPAPFQRPGSSLARLEKGIRKYMASEPPPFPAPPGSRIEWRIHHSHNSLRLDREERLVFELGP